MSQRSRLLADLFRLVTAAAFLAASGCRTGGPDLRSVLLLHQPMPETLPVPVDGVATSRLVDSWGDTRDGGRGHQGIDIFAPRYTPVRSTTDGVLRFKGMRGLGGRIVDILGPGGYRHYYAHLEDFAGQRIGDWVRQGEVIGYVGNSGNAAISPTHLHYGIYAPSGEAVDPYPFLTSGADRLAR
jgi:peptidoglycan LD-endopeptidase LytH